MILLKAINTGAALEAFFGWVAGWDAYEAEHGLDGGIWQTAFQEAKARAPLGSLEGILFSPFAAWQEALKIATKTDNALTVIGKADDIVSFTGKNSKTISSMNEQDIMKGNRANTKAVPNSMADEGIRKKAEAVTNKDTKRFF